MNQLNVKGLKDGPWEIYHDGKLVHKGHYENGVQHGYFEERDKRTGKLGSKGFYKNNKRFGYWEMYFDNGHLAWFATFDNGEDPIGYSEDYHVENGTLKNKEFWL